MKPDSHIANRRGIILAHGATSRAPRVCVDCRHAQCFALQSCVFCTLPEGLRVGQVIGAGQPACGRFAPRT